LGERAHLIEFPSLLLPPGVKAGSIVNISVNQNVAEEKKRDNEFWALQNDILDTYGKTMPEPPKLEVRPPRSIIRILHDLTARILQLRNVTQTSVTLEWSPLQLATSKLRSLDIYRNRQRLASIPSPLQNTSTKLSGLALDTEYALQLILRTTAGTFPSNLVKVKTHTMTNTSGISVCFGTVQDLMLLENAKMALREMGAKWSEKIQIDTTHFVCTTPAVTPPGAQASGAATTAPGVEYQRALQLSIPVVQPQWVLACHAEKRSV
jgi:chitin biosynthesis protein CHS5